MTKYKFFDRPSDGEAIVDYKHTWHGLTGHDALKGESGQSGAIVSYNNALILGGPRKHDWIDCSLEPDILNANQIQIGKTKQ